MPYYPAQVSLIGFLMQKIMMNYDVPPKVPFSYVETAKMEATVQKTESNNWLPYERNATGQIVLDKEATKKLNVENKTSQDNELVSNEKNYDKKDTSMVVSKQKIYFKTGKWTSKQKIDVTDLPKEASYKVIGYTDPRGSDEYNKDLSKKRAGFVANQLNKKERTVDTIEGRGETELISNGDPSKFNLDRRVVIKYK